MIVVAIIGILAAIAIPQFQEYRVKAFNAAAKADLRNAMTAEEAYYAVNQEYFKLKVTSSSTGYQNSTYSVSVSKNVDLDLKEKQQTYTGTASHSSGDTTYSVTGSVGVIR